MEMKIKMEMKMKIDITKQKIKEATIHLMNACDNPSEVTSRAIAKEAGVQLAMINYCFGCREGLIFNIFQDLTKRCFESNKELNEILLSNIPPKEKLRHLHYVVADFLLNNYAYTKAVTGYVLLNRDLSQGLNSLPLIIEHFGNRKTLQECQIISYELSSVMQLAINRHEALYEFCKIDMNDKSQLHKFIDMQIEMFLTD